MNIFYPGKPLFDMGHNRVQAHGGSLFMKMESINFTGKKTKLGLSVSNTIPRKRYKSIVCVNKI